MRAAARASSLRSRPCRSSSTRATPRCVERVLKRARGNEDALERFRTRVRRRVADIDYFLAEPLGWREGTVVVWAGMRGAITLAAAQTLPEDAPQRSLLILIAFLVAAGSLVIQGGTLPRVVALVKPAPEREDPEERGRLRELLIAALEGTSDEPIAKLDAQRRAILELRDEGTFSANALNRELALLDAAADRPRAARRLSGQTALDDAIHSLGREDVLDHHDPGADRAGPVAEARGHDPQVARRQRE